MVTYSTLDIIAIVFLAIVGIICLLYLRFAPTKVSNRSRRYIHPPKNKRKGVKR